jgi:integral membrane sensor domain MASE1
LQAVWLFGGFARVLTPFTLVVFFLAPVMLASTRPGWVPNSTVLTIAALGAVFLGITTSYLLSRLLTDSSDTEQTLAARAAFALLVLAWGPLMAYQLSNIPGLQAAHLLVDPGSLLASLVPGSGVNLLVLFQLTVILLAALLALITYWRIRYRAKYEEISSWRTGWNILLMVGCLYALFSLLIVVK